MNASIRSHIKPNINLVHTSEPHKNKHLKWFFYFIFILLNLNFSLLTYSQESPFPTDHLQLWLSADSVELIDGKVSRWYDLSHNNFNIYGPSATRYPDLKENAINGHPAITFNGTTQDLYSQSILNIGQKGWSYFIIAESNNDVAIISKYDRRNSDWNILPMWFIDRNRLFIRETDVSVVSYTNAESQKYQMITAELYDRINYTHKIYCNSFLKGTQSHNATASDDISNSLPFRIGHNYTSALGNGTFYKGEIAEIIAFDTISENLRNTVHNYLYSKYAAIVSLGLDILANGFCDTAITTAYNPDFISYQWSTGETDSVIHVNRSGRYTVTVTNSFGVTSTDDINVYFPEHFQLQDTTICAGDTIFWNTGLNVEEYTFQWMKDEIQYADVSNQIEISDTGAYTCLITDSLGCSLQTDTVHIAIDDYPISTSFIADVTCSVQTDTAMCSGNTLGIASNIDETTSYIWNTGASSPRITLTESGDYSLTTTNRRGCRAINSINVNILGEAPEINFNIDNLCFKDSTSFVGNAYSEQGIESYLWIIDNTDSITEQSFNHRFATTGIHNIRTIVSSINTCRNDSSFNIIIKEIPYPNFTYTPVCTGIPMNFIGNSTIPDSTSIESYTWLINDSVIGTNENLPFGTDDAGIVPLKYSITLSNGCQSDTTINISISNEYSEPRYVSPAYPTNGMLVSSDSITFSWNYDYDILYYNLITSPSADFSSTDTIACTTNNITLPSPNFADTTYWKVSSYNHCLLSFESEPYFFRETTGGSDFISSNPNLQLWLRADSVEVTDGKVSRWYDLSHNSFNIYGPSSTRYPDIKENVINGHPAITFNGTTQDLYSQNILNIGPKGWSYFIIAKSNNDVAIISKYDRRNSDWNILPMWFIDRNRLLIREPEESIVTYTNAESQKYQLITTELYDRINFTHKIYCNSILQDTQNHTATASDDISNSLPFRIGRNYTSASGNGSFYKGEIAEIIAFDTISENLRNIVHNYLYSKYAAIVSLDLDIHTTSFCDTVISTAYTPDFISYQWSTGETDSVIHVNRIGRYTVTVTNSFGVTSTDDINVYFPEHFQLQDTTICAGDTIHWNLKMRQDEYSFQWYKDGAQLDNASNQIEISEAGAYTCLITDSLGCSFQTDTMHLTIDNYPISAGFENSDTTLCYGNRLHLSSNYEETVSAIWNDGTTDLEYYLTQPGTYTVTTTNTRGCTATNSINVNIQGRVPTPNFTTEGHCQNAEITTTNLSTSEIGEISLYRWYANDSLIGTTENISHSFEEYGTQSLKLYLETSDHCFNDTTIPIYIYPQPKPDFSPKHFCQNAPTEISARTTIAEGDIINHLWNLEEGNIAGENITNTFESYGIKTITLSAESEQGCIGTKDTEVNVLQAEMPATEISGVCLGYETTFINKTPFNNINPQTAWEWNFGDNTETSSNKNTAHTYDTTGTYNVSLTVSFANHCSTTTDTTITIHELPEATITANDGCVGSETTLDAEIISVDNIVTYKWQIDSIFESSEQRPTFVSDTTGTFAVTLDVLTKFSCPAQATDSIIIHGKPDVAFTQSREWGGSPLYVEFENTSEGATSYHWDFGDAGESSQTNPYFIFTEPGTYEVSLTGTNIFGCSSKYTSSAITVVEPIVDIMLMDLKANEENGFAKISLIIVNLGTLPVEDLVLELKINTQIYHETIGHIAQGAVVPHTFGTMIPIPNSASIANTICVEALVPDAEGHSDMNLANNSLCITDAENLSVGIPYPIPASEQITCDIYTKIPTDLDISIFNIFGKLVKHEQISQHKGYMKYVVNVTDLASGMYFIRVNSKDESITHKFEIR
ncbi:MAG: PKD domain-containing protein [Bacteroidales bacterium]|nr:PKD domain-containing protein [Bacteroidales bacterium]